MCQNRTSAPRFEVRLSVQVLRLDKCNILLFRSRADKDISRDGIVIEDLDHIPNAHVFPGRDLPVWSRVSCGVVEQVVMFRSLYDLSIIKFKTVKLFLDRGRRRVVSGLSPFRRSSSLKHLYLRRHGILALLGTTLDELWYEAANKGLALALHSIMVVEVASCEDTSLRIIYGPVGLVSLDVFVSIFQRGDSENDEKR